jgi:hypothetical protein
MFLVIAGGCASGTTATNSTVTTPADTEPDKAGPVSTTTSPAFVVDPTPGRITSAGIGAGTRLFYENASCFETPYGIVIEENLDTTLLPDATISFEHLNDDIWAGIQLGAVGKPYDPALGILTGRGDELAERVGILAASFTADQPGSHVGHGFGSADSPLYQVTVTPGPTKKSGSIDIQGEGQAPSYHVEWMCQ